MEEVEHGPGLEEWVELGREKLKRGAKITVSRERPVKGLAELE